MARPLKVTQEFDKVVFLLMERDDCNPLHPGYDGENTQTIITTGSGSTLHEALMYALENSEIIQQTFDNSNTPIISVWMLNKNNTSCKDFVYIGELHYGKPQFIPAS